MRIPLAAEGPSGCAVVSSVQRAGWTTHRALIVVRNGLEKLFSLTLVLLDDVGRRACIYRFLIDPQRIQCLLHQWVVGA